MTQHPGRAISRRRVVAVQATVLLIEVLVVLAVAISVGLVRHSFAAGLIAALIASLVIAVVAGLIFLVLARRRSSR